MLAVIAELADPAAQEIPPQVVSVSFFRQPIRLRKPSYVSHKDSEVIPILLANKECYFHFPTKASLEGLQVDAMQCAALKQKLLKIELDLMHLPTTLGNLIAVPPA